jgi:hypothetical protein
MALGIPSPSFTTFMLLHQKLPTIITKHAYFSTFIGGPKGGEHLYASIGECPMFQKGK